KVNCKINCRNATNGGVSEKTDLIMYNHKTNVTKSDKKTGHKTLATKHFSRCLQETRSFTM
ncbi:MAG: hypothetical protein SPL83_10210, partial [Succinivibrio sp.]|nr:hypothetical protein [Succinivibrio sp.]